MGFGRMGYMGSDLISVIVPVYNAQLYLERCLESILKQSYKNLEILLVDDGSTDMSGKICDQYADLDKRVKVIHKDNQGLVSARKAGINAASGKYIGFVDSDDYIEPDFYWHLYEILVKTGADFVNTGILYEFVDKQKKVIPRERCISFENTDKAGFIRKNDDIANTDGYVVAPAMWSKLFNREFIRKCYFAVADGAQEEDLAAFYKCILECRIFAEVPYAEYHYQVRRDSISNQYTYVSMLRRFIGYNCIYNTLTEYGCHELLDGLLQTRMTMRMLDYVNEADIPGLEAVTYIYPSERGLDGKSIVLYGAGKIGRSYYSQLCMSQYCRIAAWVDKKYNNRPQGVCLGVERLHQLEFDLLIIAVKDYALSEEIAKELVENGIDKKKIQWKEPIHWLKGEGYQWAGQP